MKMNKSFCTACLIVLFMLVVAWTETHADEYCYVPYGGRVHAEFVAKGSIVRINWVEGERGMEASAEYTYDSKADITVCVITARMPDFIIGDPDMDSLGHELLHCLTGNFHEGED